MYVLEGAFFLDLGVTYFIIIVLPTAIPTSGYLCEASYRVQCCLREGLGNGCGSPLPRTSGKKNIGPDHPGYLVQHVRAALRLDNPVESPFGDAVSRCRLGSLNTSTHFGGNKILVTGSQYQCE